MEPRKIDNNNCGGAATAKTNVPPRGAGCGCGGAGQTRVRAAPLQTETDCRGCGPSFMAPQQRRHRRHCESSRNRQKVLRRRRCGPRSAARVLAPSSPAVLGGRGGRSARPLPRRVVWPVRAPLLRVCHIGRLNVGCAFVCATVAAAAATARARQRRDSLSPGGGGGGDPAQPPALFCCCCCRRRCRCCLSAVVFRVGEGTRRGQSRGGVGKVVYKFWSRGGASAEKRQRHDKAKPKPQRAQRTEREREPRQESERERGNNKATNESTLLFVLALFARNRLLHLCIA